MQNTKNPVVEKKTVPVQVKQTNAPSLEAMLEAGVHFGHKTAKWYPKMKPFIYGVRHGVHIIDLEKTQSQLNKAMALVSDIAARGGDVLFVGTKKQAKNAVAQAAIRCGMPYITERWLGGTFTNFNQIAKLARRYRQLKSTMSAGDVSKYTKKEQADFAAEIEYLEKKVGGILSLDALPQAVVIIGLKEEETAIKESVAVNVPIIALCDTNTDPSLISVPIPGNDDAVRSVQLVCDALAEAISANRSGR